MAEQILKETFSKASMDSRLKWFCPPTRYNLKDDRLVIEPDGKTDYWQKTHYGYESDNGHFLHFYPEGNFQLTTRLALWPEHQYDQAGLMLRYSPHFWIKTSVEHMKDEGSQLGAVVTNFGYSDWSHQKYSSQLDLILLRIRFKNDDITIDFSKEDNADLSKTKWTQIRIAHLTKPKDMRLQCGLYACCPTEAGCRAEFRYLLVEGID